MHCVSNVRHIIFGNADMQTNTAVKLAAGTTTVAPIYLPAELILLASAGTGAYM